MRYASAGAFRRALETRLAAQARETGRSIVRLRKEVAFDRLLARLFAVAPDGWVLKGALALDYRFGDRARTTKDIDLASAGDEASATTELLAAQAVDLGASSTSPSNARPPSIAWWRVPQCGITFVPSWPVGCSMTSCSMWASTANRRRARPVAWARPPGFRRHRAGRGPSGPDEFHVAEKLHAYSRVYAVGSVGSTRVKDLIDLALIASGATLDAGRLRAAIETTFVRRASDELPTSLPRPPADWRVPYGRMARRSASMLTLRPGSTRRRDARSNSWARRSIWELGPCGSQLGLHAVPWRS